MPRWPARRPAAAELVAQIEHDRDDDRAALGIDEHGRDVRLDLAVRAAEIRYRSEATEIVLRDRHDPAWLTDVRGWLDPITRLAERT